MPLYYTGLSSEAEVQREGGKTEKIALARDYSTEAEVQIPAHSRTWLLIRAPGS